MGVLVQIAQLILSLAILVFVHEMGHFMFARLFKVRVEKFYLFFNPWFTLFKYKSPKSGTEYGLGWLPLGGYCKIAGMVDESMDTEAMAQEPQPWEFRSRPAWQRFFIITGGVIMNFILALIIYSMVLFVWGKEYLPIQNVKWGYSYCEVAKKAGFEDGDKVLKIEDFAPETMQEALTKILFADGKTVVLERNGNEVEVVLPKDFSQQILASKTERFAQERVPFVIGEVTKSSPAEAAHLLAGDSIVGFNGKQLPFFADFSDSIKNYAGKEVALSFFRDGNLMTQNITLTDEAKLGVYPKNPVNFFKIEKKTYGFFESIPAGVKLGVNTLGNYAKQLKFIFTKEGAKSLGGFGTIGGLFTKVWDWERFWGMTAFLSIILAFMNILPIPALDGGHMMFILYEMITRRKPSEKFMERAQVVGMVILLLLLVVANGNDIIRWLFK